MYLVFFFSLHVWILRHFFNSIWILWHKVFFTINYLFFIILLYNYCVCDLHLWKLFDIKGIVVKWRNIDLVILYIDSNSNLVRGHILSGGSDRFRWITYTIQYFLSLQFTNCKLKKYCIVYVYIISQQLLLSTLNLICTKILPRSRVCMLIYICYAI